ncbi:AraC family transcriptional regulator [Marinobacterium arenosum]|uniref:AraC family transcriptional regulator n=1 Tax=Marinobacterium arenosum TaxID=2862496 RepID=UPI001C95A1DA|nr:AraC family transcriptional regulator [Marinobacterium arenosum]MBY4678099.1 AraC family transcriptional regulator [Marinobacterium arenosum]
MTVDQIHTRTPLLTPGLELAQAHIRSFSFDPHVHLDYHVGIVSYGVQLYSNRNRRYALAPNSLALVNPDEVHEGFARDERGYQVHVLRLEPELVSELHAALAERHGELWFSQPLVEDPLLYRRLLQLHGQARQAELQPLAWQAEYLDCMEQLFARYAALRPLQINDGLSPAQLARLRDYLMADLAGKHRLEELAALFGLSSYQFLRRFRASVGMTPHAYLLSLRIDYGRRLLRRGERVCDAAMQAGFYDQSHFVRAFRKANGVAPSNYSES